MSSLSHTDPMVMLKDLIKSSNDSLSCYVATLVWCFAAMVRVQGSPYARLSLWKAPQHDLVMQEPN